MIPTRFNELSGPILLCAMYLLFFFVERRFPLRKLRIPLRKRLITNVAITLLSLLVAGLFVRPVALGLAAWIQQHRIGLVAFLPGSFWQFSASILLLDLTFYYWHRANHEIPLLWRFHNVHHVDPDMDVSTSFRFHPVETFYSTVFRAVQVLIIGINPGTYLAYELLFQSNTLCHHSNVRLPLNVERLLNKILVTPRMHGIHHSVVRRETDSNYGTVFSWWDRLHRTMILNIPQRAVNIGVAAYQSMRDNRFSRLLWIPFERQPDYGVLPDGTEAERQATDRQGPASRLAS